jgi:hypothetical protein
LGFRGRSGAKIIQRWRRIEEGRAARRRSHRSPWVVAAGGLTGDRGGGAGEVVRKTKRKNDNEEEG